LQRRSATHLKSTIFTSRPQSWMAIGWSISDADVRATADFMVSSGLLAAGYNYLNSVRLRSSSRPTQLSLAALSL
jgi:hypothetical protein